MNITNYKYINITEITGNIEVDVNNFLLQNNKQKTLEHVMAVANINSEIAEKYGLDKNICIISGYLHDISTVIHPNDMLNYIVEINYIIDNNIILYPHSWII